MNWQLKDWEYLILISFWVKLVDAGHSKHAEEVYKQASESRNKHESV